MNCKYKIKLRKAKGYALPLILVAMLILIILSFGETMTSYTTRIQAVSVKAKTEAMLAAEAGYERAIFWMCQQSDILGALQAGGGSGVIDFGTSTCAYEVSFQGFLGARPVFQVNSTGKSGRPVYTRIVDVNVMQETAGWAMGACRVPIGSSSTTEVWFKNGEIVDLPLHINKYNDSPDVADIWINTSGGAPRFLRKVEMSESRKTSGGTDKYSGVMPCFEDGIYFDQPNTRITDETAVTSKINRFRDSTAAAYQFTPAAYSGYLPAVQLEFYVSGGVGYVKISNHCRLKTTAHSDSDDYEGAYDYCVVPGSGGTSFQKYNIYKYHLRPDSGSISVPITNTYVTQQFGGYESEPGGQIYVNGNVVIGSADYVDMVVKGKITVVASGNIWIADSIVVDDNGGAQRGANGKPSADNPNVLGLIAQGVVKVVDPGRSPSSSPSHPSGYSFAPVCNGSSSTNRYLPDPLVIEAAITVGGGGFGAEYVGGRYYSSNCGDTQNRKELDGCTDVLIVRGSITEVVRGVVGIFSPTTGAGQDGYDKNYYVDDRLMTGILPGDIWFTGKYIPAPAGWHDYGIETH
jgi:hypothetical protein